MVKKKQSKDGKISNREHGEVNKQEEVAVILDGIVDDLKRVKAILLEQGRRGK